MFELDKEKPQPFKRDDKAPEILEIVIKDKESDERTRR
jgi:hypothetical protein